MTNQATIEQAAKEIDDYQDRHGHAGLETITEILRRHFSAPSDPSERLKGLLEEWRERSKVASYVSVRHVISKLESLLAEPSDELPMVLGRVPCIAASASRGWYIYDLNDQLVQLRQSGEWANPSEEPFGNYYWSDRDSAIAFLRECAAQAASEPRANLPHPYFPDYEAMGDCDVCGQVESSSAHFPASEQAASEPQQAGERPSDSVRVGSDEFAEILRGAEAAAAIIDKAIPQPMAAINVSKDGKALDICLDNSKSTYGDWIPGEGADISLIRDEETKRVVGARLPLYAKAIVFGGTVLPTLYFDLDSGQQLPDPLSTASPAPAAPQAEPT